MKKNGHIFTIIFWGAVLFLSCKPSYQKEFEQIELPAYQSDDQNRTLNRIIHVSKHDNFQKLIVNGKEYPPKQLKKILDTLGAGYSLLIKNDSISNKKSLIIEENL
ncbi:hypothetical protein [Flagellimonas sp.]|uniref:hypothetical protein n=1 Tax=Flagellimonas sp. TaxID=2058762 RepID=UPI003AB8B59C